MKILLAQALFGAYAEAAPPLGLASIAACVRQSFPDWTVMILDANVEGWSPDELAERIVCARPDVVGMTMTTPLVGPTLECIRSFRGRLSCQVMVGGPHPTVEADSLVAIPEIDVVVRGEGEETFVELLRSCRGKAPHPGILGISYREGNHPVHTPPRPPIAALDDLPIPAWDLLPLEKYRSLAGHSGLCLPILSSRGCPNHCVFCYQGVFGRKYRVRRAENVLAEIDYLVRVHRIDEFVIIDDNFSVLEPRALAIAQGLQERGGMIPWRLPQSLSLKTASPQLLRALRAAGCYQIGFGVESGDQATLDRIGKNISLDQIRSAVHQAKVAGLETLAFFMFGNPGENAATMDATIRFAIELEPDFAQFTLATPYPGTELHALIAREGSFLFKRWEDLSTYSGKGAFRLGEVTPALMERKFREAYRRFYLRPRFIWKWLRKMMTKRGIAHLWKGILLFLKLAGRTST